MRTARNVTVTNNWRRHALGNARSMPTLLRIALVFSVGLDYFFAGAREKPLVAIVRQAERVQLPERQGGKDMAYRFESLDYPATERRFNWYYAEFLPVARDDVRLPVAAENTSMIIWSGEGREANKKRMW